MIYKITKKNRELRRSMGWSNISLFFISWKDYGFKNTYSFGIRLFFYGIRIDINPNKEDIFGR